MLNKNFRRLAALTLALLLALCAGCGSSGGPAADTPAPTQAPAAPEPTTGPDAGQAPVPEPASSPTDISAPAAPLPELATPIERENPEYIHFLTQGLHFTATNAEGQTFSYDGNEGSGDMVVDHWKITDASESMPKHFYCLPEYSERFTCELTAAPEEAEEWIIELLGTSGSWYHCAVKGSGGAPEGLVYDYLDGSVTVRCTAGTRLEITLAAPDSALGLIGWIRLMAISAGDEVVLKADGNTLTFSGLDPSAPDPAEYGLSADVPAILNYGGLSSGQSLVKFSSGSGTIDLSNLSSPEITAAPAGS